jgi:hypothetical protein
VQTELINFNPTEGIKTMATQTFTTAGVSVSPIDGIKSFRFTNDFPNLRANMLRHKGHTDIELFALPRAMSRQSAMTWLLKDKDASKVCRGAVIITRAADKTTKSELVLTAEARAKAQKAAERTKVAA